MALAPEDIVVAGDGHVYLAPVGETVPDFDATPAGNWVEMGYITTDGVKFSYKRDTKDIEAWQSADPVRTIVQKLPKTISFTLQQTGPAQLILALGGGDFVESQTQPGVYEYNPPAVSDVDERALIVEIEDGTETFRYIFYRTQNKEGVTFNATRDKELGYEITMSVLTPTGGGDAYIIQTDSTTFTAS